jgi:O-antigen/teichoic acid export membrane protein
VQKLFSSQALLWAGRGFWAVADQALFAGTNFLVSILLARWLEPAAYGAFATAYAVFLLLGTLHTALWTEPMLVYGSGRFREVFGGYQRVLLGYHWRFGALIGLMFLLLGVGFWAFAGREMGFSFLGLAVAAPAVLYLWLVRRGAYVHLNPRLAALGGGLYLSLFLGLAGFLFRVQLLNEATAFLAMALASALAAEAIRWRLRERVPTQVAPSEVWALHWGYGRWALLAGALSWVPGNIYYPLLPTFHGLEAAAQFKALMNLLMPILHFNGALGSLLVPGMVRAKTGDDLKRFAKLSLLVFLALALGYWIVLTALGRELMEWLYEGKYGQASFWLPWLGVLPLFSSVVSVAGSVLRALERPQAVAAAYGLLAGFAATVGVVLVREYSLGGAVWALLLTNAFAAFAFWRLAKGKG